MNKVEWQRTQEAARVMFGPSPLLDGIFREAQELAERDDEWFEAGQKALAGHWEPLKALVKAEQQRREQDGG